MEVLSVILVTVVTFYIIHYLNTWMNKNPKNFPPGPLKLPLIGNLHTVLAKGLHQTLMELSETYGPVFSIQMGLKKIVVLAGYDAVKDALVNHAEEFEERARVPIFEKMDKGLGLPFAHGDNWKIMRRFTISTLRDFGMGKSSLEERIAEECSHMIQKIKSFKGQPFDNTRIIYSAVSNIIVSILLGNRMDYEDPQFKKLLDLMTENIRLLVEKTVLLYNAYPILGILPGSHRRFQKNINELFAFIQCTFVKHLKELDMNDQRSFIDAFLIRQNLEKANPQSYFHNDNLSGLIRSLLNAGTETLSTTLRWCLLMMIKYPHYQEKVQEEISKVIGMAQPKYSHRLQMPFTNAVVHETQRFSDVVPMSLPRESTRDVNFRGYHIPKGTQIIPLLTSVLYDKKQFKAPEEFNPINFLDSEGQFVKNEAFMVFSAGRRVCAGENLARMELFIFFTSLLQKFTFRLPPGVKEVDLTISAGFTLAPVSQKICAIQRLQEDA
ncbi:cytochrome P450 2K4-like [Bufo bufo]|uniref:cytochrome P450 2K4-like n=1 Tax=Bufo bufo TaxID=8384 RepID=UPI001ABEE310|nr:cytochrome P450 2K4-like [Bufo bufo]